MYHRPILNNSSAASDAIAFAALYRFFTEHLDGLRNAAQILAGDDGARLVNDLLDRLGWQPPLSRSTWHSLCDLLGILTLKHVHDDTRLEAALFAEIDPASPIVEEICLLSDQFRDVLDAATWDRGDETPSKAAA